MAETLIDTTRSKFQVGQKWQYRAREGEDDSSLTVLKVEESGTFGVIVHVRIDGLRMKNPHHPEGFSDTLGHMPMGEEALGESVTELVSSDPPTAAGAEDEGYREWRQAFDTGEAGAWTVTVAEAIDHIAKTLDPGQAS